MISKTIETESIYVPRLNMRLPLEDEPLPSRHEMRNRWIDHTERYVRLKIRDDPPEDDDDDRLPITASVLEHCQLKLSLLLTEDTRPSTSTRTESTATRGEPTPAAATSTTAATTSTATTTAPAVSFQDLVNILIWTGRHTWNFDFFLSAKHVPAYLSVAASDQNRVLRPVHSSLVRFEMRK